MTTPRFFNPFLYPSFAHFDIRFMTSHAHLFTKTLFQFNRHSLFRSFRLSLYNILMIPQTLRFSYGLVCARASDASDVGDKWRCSANGHRHWSIAVRSACTGVRSLWVRRLFATRSMLAVLATRVSRSKGEARVCRCPRPGGPCASRRFDAAARLIYCCRLSWRLPTRTG